MPELEKFLKNDSLGLELADQTLGLEVTRELTAQDLDKPKQAPETQALDRIRHIHHMQARGLAQGKTVIQVAAEYGVSVTTLYVLQKDPAFKELVEYYKSQDEEAWLDTRRKAAAVARLGLDILQERLETRPEKMSDNQLRQLTVDMLDRTELPPIVNDKPQTPEKIVVTLNLGTPVDTTRGKIIDGKAD